MLFGYNEFVEIYNGDQWIVTHGSQNTFVDAGRLTESQQIL